MEERAQPCGTAAQAEQRRAEERRASYLELFFDLVFVYAITQVTALILSDTSAGGFLRSALVLGMIWWAWSAYAWLTNAIDLDTTVSRLAILVAAAGSFFVALGVPVAYGDDGLWFAAPYLLVRVVHLLVYMYGLREDREYQLGVLRSLPFWLVSPVVIAAAALVDGDARAWIWGGAIALDVAGSLMAGRQTYRVSAAHFAERYLGIILFAVAAEKTVAHPGDPLSTAGRFALAAGLAVYMLASASPCAGGSCGASRGSAPGRRRRSRWSCSRPGTSRRSASWPSPSRSWRPGSRPRRYGSASCAARCTWADEGRPAA
jgi:hypothetical protein